MSRVVSSASVLLFTAILGCGGPEKELPKDIGSTERGKDVEIAAAIPTTSQPDARKRIDRCLAAATEGHPERLEKLKVNRQSVRGKWRWPSDVVSIATREFQCVWPDKARVAYEFTTGDFKKFLIVFRRPTVLAFSDDGTGSKEFAPPNPKEFAENVKIDALGEHWLPMLVPLADPKTIVFDLKKEPFGTKIAETVKVAIPDCPVYTIWFEENIDLPGMITYSHVDVGSRVQKQVILGAHKPFGGVMLPTQLESRRNGVSVQEWTVLQWEFPDKIEDSVFDQNPKK